MSASDLQNAINQYAGPAGFAPISVSFFGIPDNSVADALYKALGWIGSNVSGEAATAAGLQAALVSADGTSYNLTQLTSSESGFTTYLNNYAPQAIAAGGGIPASGAAASLANIGIPKWALYLGGAVIVLGTIALIWHGHKKRRQISAPPIGHYDEGDEGDDEYDDTSYAN